MVIIMAGYGFYRLLNSKQDLTSLGSVAYVATLHFLPAVLSTLYWPKANRRGYIFGLVAGVSVWLVTMLLPLIGGPNSFYLPGLDLTYQLDERTWHLAALASLAVNLLVFSVVSLFTDSSVEEIRAAEACAVDNMYLPQRRELEASSPQEFINQLGIPLGQQTAQNEVAQALYALQLPNDEHRPYALRRLRDHIEASLSSLMGPNVAQELVKKFLPYKKNTERFVSEDIHFIENRLEEYRSRLTGLAAELDTLRRYHRQTLQDLPMGVCSLAKDREVLMWNHAMEELTGIPAAAVVGSCLNTLPEPWRSRLEDFIQQPEEHQHKQRLVLHAKPRWLNLHKAAIEEPSSPGSTGLVLLIEDGTETQVLEEHLMHAERLASIGRLAAGVAHEIGNPVTGIACLAQNLREEREQDGELAEVSEQIIEQTKRISKILQSLMSFAHAGHARPHFYPVNLAAIAQDAMALLSLNREDTEVQFLNHCHPEHCAEGDPQRLAQVLINLLSNARDASQAHGRIWVFSQADEHSVYLIIEDEGSGIPIEIQDQLFEPFFTTKDPGKGTGLGLALVYSIIEEHYGQLDIESPLDTETQRGTRIRIRLPRHQESTPSAPTADC